MAKKVRVWVEDFPQGTDVDVPGFGSFTNKSWRNAEEGVKYPEPPFQMKDDDSRSADDDEPEAPRGTVTGSTPSNTVTNVATSTGTSTVPAGPAKGGEK